MQKVIVFNIGQLIWGRLAPFKRAWIPQWKHPSSEDSQTSTKLTCPFECTNITYLYMSWSRYQLDRMRIAGLGDDWRWTGKKSAKRSAPLPIFHDARLLYNLSGPCVSSMRLYIIIWTVWTVALKAPDMMKPWPNKLIFDMLPWKTLSLSGS